MKVELPNKTVLVSWSHPWTRIRFRGLDNVLKKITRCFLMEELGTNADGKPKVRYIASGLAIWPLYSLDGTPRKTVKMNNDELSEDKGRKIALRRALVMAGFTEMERTLVWQAYLKLFSPDIPIPPALPQLIALTKQFDGELAPRQDDGLVDPRLSVIGSHAVISKQVTPGRLIQFPITDTQRLIAPDSGLIH